MVCKSTGLNSAAELFEASHKSTLEEAERLRHVLTNLRYEGRPSFGRNIKETQGVLKFFNEELIQHVELEEEVLFPFLKTHVPKLESVIHLLEAEHMDFRLKLKNFETLLSNLQKEHSEIDREGALEKMRECGIYLIYLLQSHIQAENQSVYRVAERELHTGEKKELVEKVTKRRHAKQNLR